MSTGSGLTADQKAQFDEQGYFIIDEFLTLEEVDGVRNEITTIMDRYPDVPEELVQIEPAVGRGEITLDRVELGVRKLFRMARHNDFFRALAFQKSKNAHFSTLANLKSAKMGVSQKFIFSKMGEKLDFWWGIG